MTLGLQESRMRRRRQRRWAVVKWLVILAALIGAGVFAHETGSQLARMDVTRLESRVAELTTEIETLENEKAELRGRLRETEDVLADWQARYRAEVPTGASARLMELARERLEDGVPLDRLSFVVANARPERVCEDDPVTRRFIVQTPLSSGASDSVSFAGNAVTVTAQGVSARDDQGRREAWFDPDEPVSVRFTRLGGEVEEVEDQLPLHHSLVIGDEEHRFSILPGDNRAFAQAAWQRCAYP